MRTTKSLLISSIVLFTLLFGKNFETEITFTSEFTANNPNNSEIITNTMQINDTYQSNILPLSHYDNIYSKAMDVILADELLFLQCSDGVHIFNISNPSTPIKYAKIDKNNEDYATPGKYGVAVQDNLLIADAYIIDISDPTKPRIKSYTSIENSLFPTNEVEIVDNRIYTHKGSDNSFNIVDWRNPLYPIRMGRFQVPFSTLRAIEVEGNFAYLITLSNGMHIVNITNPYYPVEINHYPFSDIPLDIIIENNYAFVSTDSGLRILDVTNPLSINEIAYYSSVNPIYTTSVNNSLAFLNKKSYGLEIINISNPAIPVHVGNFSSSGKIENVAVKGEVVFVAAETEGLLVLNVSDPTTPTKITGFDTNKEGEYSDICGTKDIRYIATTKGLEVVNVSNPYQPIEEQLLFNQSEINCLHLDNDSNLLFVAIENLGVKILNLSFSLITPVEVGNYTFSNGEDFTYDLVNINDVLLIGLNDNGLVVLNISNPINPENISRLFAGIDARNIAVWGDYAYVITTDDGVSVLNCSKSIVPQIVSTFGLAYDFASLTISSKEIAFILSNMDELVVYNVSNPIAPTFVSITLGEFGDIIRVKNEEVIVSYGWFLYLLDTTNLSDISIKASWQRAKRVQSIVWINDSIYCACKQNGLVICSIDNDKDGLTRYEESLIGTSDNSYDTELDGLNDYYEVEYNLNPLFDDANVDSDTDGLTNLEEHDYIYYESLLPILEYYVFRLNPTTNDTDNDQLTDFDEITIHNTNPISPDSDFDMLDDFTEVQLGTEPLDPDTDGDGLEDGEEVHQFGTDPTKADTDGDGMPDDYELANNLDPLFDDADDDADGEGLTNLEEYLNGTDPNDPDTDNDDLTDYEEINDYETNPLDEDSDNDGLTDGEEVNDYNTDPNDVDTDDDGLQDGSEVNLYLTDPTNPDTDGDGFSDGEEVDLGFDPLDPKDNPVKQRNRILAFSLGSLGAIVILFAGSILFRKAGGKLRRPKREV